MTEEEKKAVEFVKKRTKELKKYAKRENELCYDDIVLNLIEKLQKENEELHKEIDQMKSLDIYKLVEDWETGQLISIQKIKDKIKEEIKYHEKNILDIENITMLKSKTAKEEAEIEFNKYAIVVLKKILQELIEESE